MKTLMLVSICLLFACSKKVDEPKAAETEKVAEVKKEAPKAEENVEKKEAAMKFAEVKYLEKDLPKTVKFSGRAKHGLRWQDKNGENWLVLSESLKTVDHHGVKHTEAQNLYATHVAINGDAVKVLRTIKEIKPECEFDWIASFEPKAMSILDLDGDGYGEATFSYRTSCTSDLINSTYKLVVLENGEKHILRGTDILSEKKYQFKGDGEFKSDGFKDSKKLLEHAKSVWDKTKTVKVNGNPG